MRFKLFTDNNVNWCRIGLDCQEAPAQRGQTRRKDWPNTGAYSGFLFRSYTRTKPSNFKSLPDNSGNLAGMTM